MKLFDIFKKKECKVQSKCNQCFRTIVGYVYTIDNNNYCRECYNRKMAVIQRTDEPPTTSAPKLKTEKNVSKELPADDRCIRCPDHIPCEQRDFVKLSDHISWKIENNILYIQGRGTLTTDDYLTITAPAPRYETMTYTRVLPWAVSNAIRQSKYISEGCPVNEIPTHIKEVVVDGEIEGLKEFLLNANNYVGVQLQSPNEYLCHRAQLLDDNAVKMKNLDLLIRDDNYDTWTACCLHKTTQEAYVVRGNNTFLGDMQHGGRMESHISSVSIASFEEVSSIANKELSYNTFYTYQSNYRNIVQKKLIIAQEEYRIEYFIVVDNIEVPQNQILFGESAFRVPAQLLTEEQRKKYAEFYTRSEPYEQCYELPSECCQKVVRKLVPINF